jgi:hydroxyacylglutathione hydrolase
MAVVVDMRSVQDFARGHARNAVSVPFSVKGLAERLAVVVEPGTPVLLVASEPETASAALAQIKDAYLVTEVIAGASGSEGGVHEDSLPDIPIQAFAAAARSGDLTVLDVREPVEWETGYVPGAVLIPLGSLYARLDEIFRGYPVAVICEAGVRSSTGASLVQAAGFSNVATVSEGMSAYRRSGLPLEFPFGRHPG